MKSAEKEYKVRLSKDEEQVIEFISKKLANGKRIHELEILNRIIHYTGNLRDLKIFTEYNSVLENKLNDIQTNNLVNVLTNAFPAGSSKNTYSECVFIESHENDYVVTESFGKMLANKDFYEIIKELVEFGISRYNRDYSNTYKNTDFVLYQKYTYEDVCRLLNYEDHFTDRNSLVAISKSGRSVASEDVQNFLNAEERGIQVELFVRKNKDDKISKEFYYLGHMKATGNTHEFIMPNTTKSAVEIEWMLDVPVREDIYQYIVNN